VQDLTQVGEAVNGLFDGSEGARCRALTMFYQSVVLESGDVVGGGLDAQDEPEFVVDLDPRCAKTMLDAGAFDAGGKLTANFLGQLGCDLMAEKSGDVFGFDRQDRLPGKLSIERFEDGLRAEHQIGGVLNLHETPVIGLRKDVAHGTALLGIAIEDVVQISGRELVGEGLRARPVVDTHKGIVGEGKADPGGSELASQPTMAIAIELQAKGTPGWYPQVDQAELGVDEVEVVMQAFAGIRPQEGAMRAFVVPGLVAVAGFHCRDDMNQAGMVAAPGDHLGDEVLLADVVLGNVFNGDARRTGQFGGAVAHAITQRFGKSRIVEDSDLPRREKGRHPLCVTGPWQGAGDDNPVVTGEHPGEALAVTLRQRMPQAPLPLRAYPAAILSCLVPAMPA